MSDLKKTKEKVRALVRDGTFGDSHLDGLRLVMALLEMCDGGMTVAEFREALEYGKRLLRGEPV